MRLGLAALVLLALVLRLGCSASSVTDAEKNTEATFDSFHRHHTSMFEHALMQVSGAEDSKAEALRAFERFVAAGQGEEEAFLQFLQAFDSIVKLLMASMKANYHMINAYASQWSPVADILTRALNGMPLSHLSQITGIEALGYAVVMLAFNSTELILEEHYEVMEKLGSRLTSDQWSELADWAIYTSRPNIYTLPQQLFSQSHFAPTQITATFMTICEVAVEGMPFRRNGFSRLECSEPALETIDYDYIFIPIYRIDWETESLEPLFKILKHLFRALKHMVPAFAHIVIAGFLELCQVVKAVLSSHVEEIRQIAINSLVSDAFLDWCKNEVFPETGENCAETLINLARLMDAKIFNDAFKTLNPENSYFALRSIQAAKSVTDTCKDISIRLSSLQGRFTNQPSEAFESIGGIVELIKKLPPNDHTATVFFRTNCQILSRMVEALDILRLTASSGRWDDMHNAIFMGLMNWSKVRYLLAEQNTRPKLALDLAYDIGCVVRGIAQSQLSQSQLNNDYALHTHLVGKRAFLDSQFPRQQLCQIFSEACEQISSNEQFTDGELSDMVVLAATIFSGEFASSLSVHLVALVTARLLKGGILNGDYTQQTGYLLPPVLNSVYLFAAAKLNADPQWQTAAKRAALRTFIHWLLANNYVSSSVRVLFSGEFP